MMDNLKRECRVASRKIHRIADWVESNLDSNDIPRFHVQKAEIEKAYQKYEDAHDQLLELVDDTSPEERDRALLEERYLTAVSTLLQLVGALPSDSKGIISPIPSKPFPQVKLPDISVPPFSGDPLQWVSFFELFTALIVNNSNLSDVEKLIYLKGYLRGEPARLIEALPVTNASFSVAVDNLKCRYSNRFLLLSNIMNSIMDLKGVTNSSATLPVSLREFHVSISNALQALDNHNLSKEECYEVLLMTLLKRKLDDGTIRHLEYENKDFSKTPTLDEFLDLINTRCVHLENLSSNSKVKTPNKETVSNTKRSAFHVASNNSNSSSKDAYRPLGRPSSPIFKCLCCGNASHKIYACPDFLRRSVVERHNFVKENKLCFNCMGGRHVKEACVSRNTCNVCHLRHHSLLHGVVANHSFANNSASVRNFGQGTRRSPGNSPHSKGQNEDIVRNQPSTSNHAAFSAHCAKKDQVLLGTVQMYFYSSEGHQVKCRALLDSGSQISFVTRRLVDRLRCPVYQQSVTVAALSSQAIDLNEAADLVAHSFYSHSKLKLSCVVLDQITSKLPQLKIDVEKLRIPVRFKLADPDFWDPAPVDILLGVGALASIIKGGFVSLGSNLPILQETSFGYVISGNLPKDCVARGSSIPNFSAQVSHSSNHAVVLHTLEVSENNLDDMVQKFWESEELTVSPPLSPEAEMVEKHFSQSTLRMSDGSFQVSLPLLEDHGPSTLGVSYPMAKRRLISLQQKLALDISEWSEYAEVVEQYLSLGHVQEVPLQFRGPHNWNSYFLPHFAVKKDSGTSKTRVVFDGSAPSSSGVALNDLFHNGPTVQPALYDILLRLRTFAYVYVADIKQMYRQIHVDPSQCFLLNFLWRNQDSTEVVCLQHRRLVFGLRPAAYLATRVLNQLAMDQVDSFPSACEALLQQTYMDDILSGVDSEQELFDLSSQLNAVLNSAQFEVHKQCSNSKQFLNSIKVSKSEFKDFRDSEESNKLLGLRWFPNEDMFTFSFPSVEVDGPVTKRGVLTVVAQCWDPLGFLSPIVLRGKLLIQKVWSMSLKWDEPILDKEFLSNWFSFLADLPLISGIRIPRRLWLGKAISFQELHVFCDASTAAYATVAYVRTGYTDSTYSVALITSKTRVAPLKVKLTIPKLELSAMLLGAELVRSLIRIFQKVLVFRGLHLWTDSEIALHWVNSPSSRWNPFVANRVRKIQDLTEGCSWHHVISKNNAADVASRGMSADDLSRSSSWSRGPSFLSNFLDYEQFKLNLDFSSLPESKPSVSALLCASSDEFWLNLFNRYSSFSRFVRVIAYVRRFIVKCRLKDHKSTNSDKALTLSVSELDQAERSIVKAVQASAFSQVLNALKSGLPNPEKRLWSLALYFDSSSGLLKVGGRLDFADVSEDQRHPVLLPARHKVVTLMMREIHVRLGHVGPQSMLSNLRLKFWPLDGLREAKRIVRQCVICFRFRAKGQQQIMSSLPRERVGAFRPFLHVCVDYGGFFWLKSSHLRKAPVYKAYIALFICQSTKAVHIELVSSLSTEHFLLTLKRFVARRGNPRVILSDNGTNFSGANNSLKELYEFFKEPKVSLEVANFCSSNRTDFKFIPPRSPHFGGLHEGAIKSAKYHLRRLVGERQYPYEQFSTILAQIEAILNSRPLVPLSNDPSDCSALTPAHFLVGTELTAHPEVDIASTPSNRLSLYQEVVRLRQVFWKRWKADYFHQLQTRVKWKTEQSDIKVDTLVLVKEDGVPPLHWPLARVIEVFPGKDGHVRTVRVRTPVGEYIRPVVKICPLPLDEVPSEL